MSVERGREIEMQSLGSVPKTDEGRSPLMEPDPVTLPNMALPVQRDSGEIRGRNEESSSFKGLKALAAACGKHINNALARFGVSFCIPFIQKTFLSFVRGCLDAVIQLRSTASRPSGTERSVGLPRTQSFSPGRPPQITAERISPEKDAVVEYVAVFVSQIRKPK